MSQKLDADSAAPASGENHAPPDSLEWRLHWTWLQLQNAKADYEAQLQLAQRHQRSQTLLVHKYPDAARVTPFRSNKRVRKLHRVPKWDLTERYVNLPDLALNPVLPLAQTTQPPPSSGLTTPRTKRTQTLPRALPPVVSPNVAAVAVDPSAIFSPVVPLPSPRTPRGLTTPRASVGPPSRRSVAPSTPRSAADPLELDCIAVPTALASFAKPVTVGKLRQIITPHFCVRTPVAYAALPPPPTASLPAASDLVVSVAEPAASAVAASGAVAADVAGAAASAGGGVLGVSGESVVSPPADCADCVDTGAVASADCVSAYRSPLAAADCDPVLGTDGCTDAQETDVATDDESMCRSHWLMEVEERKRYVFRGPKTAEKTLKPDLMPTLRLPDRSAAVQLGGLCPHNTDTYVGNALGQPGLLTNSSITLSALPELLQSAIMSPPQALQLPTLPRRRGRPPGSHKKTFAALAAAGREPSVAAAAVLDDDEGAAAAPAADADTDEYEAGDGGSGSGSGSASESSITDAGARDDNSSRSPSPVRVRQTPQRATAGRRRSWAFLEESTRTTQRRRRRKTADRTPQRGAHTATATAPAAAAAAGGRWQVLATPAQRSAPAESPIAVSPAASGDAQQPLKIVLKLKRVAS